MKLNIQLLEVLLHYYTRMYFQNTHPEYYDSISYYRETDVLNPKTIVILGNKEGFWLTKHKEYKLCKVTPDNPNDIRLLNYYGYGMPSYHDNVINKIKKHFPELKVELKFSANDPIEVV